MNHKRVLIFLVAVITAVYVVEIPSAVGYVGGSKINAENYDQVNSWLYRGGEPSESDLQNLQAMGIKTIIDFRIRQQGVPAERAKVVSLGMRYVNIPWEPEFYVANKYDYDAIAKDFLEIMDDPKYRPLYVHCQHGRDRTGSMISIYRITREGWGWEQAIDEMKRYGFNTFFYGNITQFIKKFDKVLVNGANEKI